MEGCFMFQWGVCFSDGGGLIFKWGVRPIGGSIGFDGGVSKEIARWGGGAPPHAPHYGKP